MENAGKSKYSILNDEKIGKNCTTGLYWVKVAEGVTGSTNITSFIDHINTNRCYLLFIVAQLPNGGSWCTLTIPAINGLKGGRYRCGYYQNGSTSGVGNGGGAYYDIYGTYIKLVNAYQNSVDVTSTTKTDVSVLRSA